MATQKNQLPYVDWFRNSAPYIHAHRGRTFVISFTGEAVSDKDFANLIHDLAVLNSLGIRLVLVHGSRPQIEQRLQQRDTDFHYVNGLRITDDAALACVKEANGAIRVEIEALLSMGVANSPMAGAHIRVSSGNFVTAKPLGIREGVDYLHTGEVRSIDTAAIQQQLDHGNIILLSPLGYSPTGEVFNLSAEEVATSTAIELGADKLIFLTEGSDLRDSRRKLIAQLTPADAEKILLSRRKLPEDIHHYLHSASHACRYGVHRTHIINRHTDGALLLELFTRDGNGTLVSIETYEDIRPASIDDVGGILELVTPLEQDGILVRRSRELLEMEINHFTVIERDGMILACAALYPYVKEGVAELACLVVHPDYQKGGRGDTLLQHISQQAKQQDIHSLFVLTTRTTHWFRERGFKNTKIDQLPVKRRGLYNYQRNSKVLIRKL
ncbi:MAG: amino-acid N-acetyltransferase [Gammaproteobacteria bacterium]|nr:amino-acid N-acetyltransferase [Gammaproteobacteria bacterium]